MTLALYQVFPFFSITTSNSTEILKRNSIRVNPFKCISCHCRKTHAHRRKPTISFRLSFSNCFNFLVSGVVVVSSTLVLFNPVADAVGKPNGQVQYPCEDIARYYSGVDGLEGDELMVKLASIVSAHHSLPYKDVWNALKVLDAADVDNPETSSEVIEIYTSRAVSKLLAGKPEGWNREHLWPRSYGLTDGPTLSDLHNLRPADVNGKGRYCQVPDVHGCLLWFQSARWKLISSTFRFTKQ